MCLCLAVGAVAFNGKLPKAVDPMDELSDYSCDQKGYLQYLSQWSEKEKSTSRDVTDEEFQKRLSYFIDSCREIRRWNNKKQYRKEFTFYADWSAAEFASILDTEQRYSGMRPEIQPVTPVYNNTNNRRFMFSVNPCDGDAELRETVSKPQTCSVSWAFAITNSIEYAIKKMYLEEHDQIMEVSLSAQELIDCVDEEDAERGCKGLALSTGFDYVLDNGIALSEDYPFTNKTWKMQDNRGQQEVPHCQLRETLHIQQAGSV